MKQSGKANTKSKSKMEDKPKTENRSKCARPILTISGVVLTILVGMKSIPSIDKFSAIVKFALIPWCVFFLMVCIISSLLSIYLEHFKIKKETFLVLDTIAGIDFLMAMILLAILINSL